MTEQEQLKALLEHVPETGFFYWKVPNGKHVYAGDKAGTLTEYGYIRIDVLGKCHRAHRLAWLYMTGEWPKKLVDHKNLVKSDNSWDNLRLANHSQNKMNAPIRPDNTSGFKGVSPVGNKWKAYYTADKKQRYLGLYKTPEEAFAVREEYAKKHYGEFYRTH